MTSKMNKLAFFATIFRLVHITASMIVLTTAALDYVFDFLSFGVIQENAKFK